MPKVPKVPKMPKFKDEDRSIFQVRLIVFGSVMTGFGLYLDSHDLNQRAWRTSDCQYKIDRIP